MPGRPERPSKKARTLSTDSEGNEEAYDWPGSTEPRASRPEKEMKNETSRPRRNTGSENVSTASVSRGPPGTKSPTSMRLTVKTSSTKLREATRTSSSGGARDPFAGGEIIEGKRNRIVKKSYIIPNESDVDSDESMEDPADEDAEEEDDEEADMDAEDEEMGDDDPDGDGDIDMEVDVPSLPPVIKAPKASGKGKNIVVVKPPAPKSKVAPVEQKEAEDASDDEELSELDSDLGEEVEEEEGMQTGNEEDAEGEDEEIDVEEGEEEEEDSLLSDEGTPGMGSRASSPDLNKLTKRQRARFEESDGGHLMALPDEVQVKKHLTAEEHAMRRTEMARRRKNLSEKRNEEEKMETINKLLKKQAPKTNARRNMMNAAADTGAVGGAGTGESEGGVRPDAMFVRWVSSREGNRIGVPAEWLDAPVGEVFRGSVKPGGRKLVQEVS